MTEGPSVVIVTHNSADVLTPCLRSIPAFAEVIIVDNASSDGWRSAVDRCRPETRTVSLDMNVGFGAACNRGARIASRSVVVFMNPDVVVMADTLAHLTRRIEESSAPLIVGPEIQDQEGRRLYVCRRRSRLSHDIFNLLALRRVPCRFQVYLPPRHPIYRRGGTVDSVQGACLAVARARFLSINGFDERFFLYSEEEDLCERFRRMGGAIVYDPAVAVQHRWGTSTMKIGAAAAFHFYRSRMILYSERYSRPRLIAGAALMMISALIHVASVPLRLIVRRPTPRRTAESVNAVLGIAAGLRVVL